MIQIYKDLYQFSAYIPQMDFTLHQYLLAAAPAALFATGTRQQASAILPEIRELLGGRPLKYVFVSHVESDECGGLSVILDAWPEVTVLCGALAARELPGYGYGGRVVVGSPEAPLRDGELSLRFISYPSEVHLQDGLTCYEENRGIFYSSDLMLRFGDGRGKTLQARWEDEVKAVSLDRVPDEARLTALGEGLLSVAPRFVAVGHGFCVECERSGPSPTAQVDIF